MQNKISQNGPLLSSDGSLAKVGWSPHPVWDCNLEDAQIYAFKPLQSMRVKRWDYYAVFTPTRFFSATIANLGYAGSVFVYTLDFSTGDLHEEELVIPLGKGISLPRNCTEGEASFTGKGVTLKFSTHNGSRSLFVDWPGFDGGRGIKAEISLTRPTGDESMNLVIPMPRKRFYLNSKINCQPASGYIQYGNNREELLPENTLGLLDWGRGIWEYSSFWNWASASGFQPDGSRVGLNFGRGFGDTSTATENAVILDGKIHKLDQVPFEYDATDYMQPWRFRDSENRLDLVFTPFKDRTAHTNLGIIFSEVHQIFGRYNGTVILDNGDRLEIRDLVGFAEEHHARW